MRITLPLVGQIRTGKDAVQSDLIPIQTDDLKSQEKILDILGGFLDFSRRPLSDEKSISKKLLEVNKEWVYRNNDVIAQEVSRVELQLFSVDLKGGEVVFNEIQDHPLLDLLDRFNSTTTRADAFYITQSHKKLAGDAFWYLNRDGQTVVDIFILPPDKVELKLGDPTDATANLIEGYIYKDMIDGKEIIQQYSRDDIIHFKKPNPKNPFRGLGAVEALADTIDADALTGLTQANFFKKGAISNFVLTTDSKLTQDQLKRLRAELKAQYTGAQNAFTTMIFGNGLKPSPIGFSNRDMEFLSLLEWYRDKIMIGFGNTKATLGIIDDVNRASYESAHASWLRSTVDPDMAAIIGTLNEFLVPLFGKNLLLGYKNPVPDDQTNDINLATELKQAGIITINEAREMSGLDATDGGDIFAPQNPAISTPDGPGITSTSSSDTSSTDQSTPAENKRFRFIKTTTDKHIPAALRNIDLNHILRQRKIFTQQRANQAFKEAVKPFIRKVVNGNHKTEPQIHAQFTNEQVNTYYEKQMHVVDVMEGRFEQAVLSLLNKVQATALHNLDNEVGKFASVKRLKRFAITKELFDPEQLKVEAQLDLTPLLMQELILAGQEAYRLISSEDTYLPYKVADKVKEYVDRFASSMLETDKQFLTQIIADGVEAGSSVPEIRSNIQEKFAQYSKLQAERITRTEVLRVSNLAAEDAFIQSGVVEAKQWLVAPNACPLCQPYSGKIVGLGKNFYEPDNSGFQDGNCPLHVSCRCVLIPIVVGTRGFEPARSSERELLQAHIQELEAQIDKRTKVFKEMHDQKADDAAYIKALEKHLGVQDD